MANVAKGFLFIWMIWVTWGAICYAPAAQTLGETGRVIFFHVPVAWVSVLAFFTSMYHGVQTLRTGSIASDIGAEAAARLGLLFCVLATITGAMFAKAAWNSYWNWDPRETSIVVLMMIYVAYFGLRAAIPDPERRARVSAVYAILAFFSVPFLVFVVPRTIFSLHPDTVINANASMNILDDRMKHVFFSAIAGFTGIYLWMYNLTVRVERLARGREGLDV